MEEMSQVLLLAEVTLEIAVQKYLGSYFFPM